MTALLMGCATTKTVTEYKYIHPEIPTHLLEPCPDVPISISTNGELLNTFITLQTEYLVCSSKISSIATILQSYVEIYESSK